MKIEMYIVGKEIPVTYFSWIQKKGWYIPDFGHKPYWRDLNVIPKQEVLDALNEVSLKANDTAFSSKDRAIQCAKERSSGVDVYVAPIARSCPVFTVMVDIGCNRVTDFIAAEIYIDKAFYMFGDGNKEFDEQPNHTWDFSSEDEANIYSFYFTKQLNFPIVETREQDINDFYREFQPILERKQAELLEITRQARNNQLPVLEPDLEIGRFHDEIERVEIRSSWCGPTNNKPLFIDLDNDPAREIEIVECVESKNFWGTPMILSMKKHPPEVIEAKQAESEQQCKDEQDALELVGKIPPIAQNKVVKFM